MTDRELFQQALDAWQTSSYGQPRHHKAMLLAMTAIGEALVAPQPAQPADIPKIGCVNHDCGKCKAAQSAEPVAWAIFTDAGNARMWTTFQPHIQKLADAEDLTVTPLYLAPQPQRQPLTDEQIDDIWAGVSDPSRDEIDMIEFARAIEQAHGVTGEDK